MNARMLSCVCVLWLAAGCGSDRELPLDHEHVTRMRLHYFRSALLRFARETESLPEGEDTQVVNTLMRSVSEETGFPMLMLLENDPYPSLDDAGSYLDAWGNPISIEWTNSRSGAVLRSSGPDERSGTGDDITINVSL